MQFEIRTLILAVSVSVTCCAAARFLLWRLHPGIPGLGRWAWSGVLAAVALAAIAFRDHAPAKLLLTLAQVLIAVGFVLSWDGFRRFLNRPKLSRPLLCGLFLAIFVPIGLAHIDGALMTRSVVNAAFVAVISGLIAWELFKDSAKRHRSRRVTALLYGLNALFFVIRAAVAWENPEAIGLPREAGFTTITLLWWLAMSVAITLGMALMTGERLQDDLDQQASRDPLTGVLNRRAFALMSEKEVSLARRNRLPLSLLMMDLDHFKRINDHLGHPTGDAILRCFVAVAARVLRGEDVLCRYGGEEFLALLPGSSAAQALAVAERLREAFSEEARAVLPRGAALPFVVTVSVGVGELLPDEELEEAIHRADEALYRAKAAGRNRSELAVAGAPA